MARLAKESPGNPSSSTLPALLNILEKCQWFYETNEATCLGTLMSPHWFTSAEQDKQLVSTIQYLSKKVGSEEFLWPLSKQVLSSQ